MKKNLLMTAALAAMVLASCSQDNGAEISTNAKPAQLSIKLAGVVNSSTRAIEVPGVETEGTIELENGHIFVLNPAGNVTYNEALDVDAAMGVAGQTLAKDVASDSRVYILGNIPADATIVPANLTSLTEIQAASDAMTTVEMIGSTATQSYMTAPLANVGGTPATILLNGVTDADPDTGDTVVEATATVTINPLISRIELGKVTGNEWVAAFTVAGVYVDDWYPSFTYGGSFAGKMFQQKTGTDFTLNTLKDEGTWAAVGVDTDEEPTTANLFVATPDATGSVWAHNVAAGGLPRLLIKLTGVKYYPEDLNTKLPITDAAAEDLQVQSGDLYLTVTSYTGVTTFERGKIYNIGGDTEGDGDGITFGPDDTGKTPNPGNVTLNVTVKITEWDVVYPTANL